MGQIRDQGGTGLLAAHLARLGTDTTWKDGPSSTKAGGLVDATLRSATTPSSGVLAAAETEARCPRVWPAGLQARGPGLVKQVDVGGGQSYAASCLYLPVGGNGFRVTGRGAPVVKGYRHE